MKHRIFLILSGLLMSISLVACNGGASPPPPAETPASEPAEENPEAAAAEEDDPAGSVLTVGAFADAPPFEERRAGGELVGFDIDLMNAIAEEAGLTVEYSDTPWGILSQILKGQAEFGELDLIISAVSITSEREEHVDFSDPYFKIELKVAAPAGSDIQTVEDLDNRFVGVLAGTTMDEWVRNNTQANIKTYRTMDDLFQALFEADGVEAIVSDGPVLVEFVARNPDSGVALIEGPDLVEFYGIAVPPGNAGLLDQINAGLAAVIESGDYDRLCEKWFDSAAACPLDFATPSAPLAAEDSPPDDPPPPETVEPETATPAEPTPLPEVTEEIPAPQPISCEVQPNLQAAGRLYEIEAGDWLSGLAGREYGNPLDYRAILFYTNQQCQTDSRLTCLENPDRVEPGWSIYLPSSSEVEAYWEDEIVLPPVEFEADGAIETVGSSTVFPLTQQVATCFREKGFTGQVAVESVGTGAGFEQFCQDPTIDIVNASRPITEEELALCQSNGREPLELQVGTDAIAVVVSRQNDFIGDVTSEELQQILAGAETWAAVNPNWPDQPIERFYPTADSGTFDVLVDRVFAGDEAAVLEAANVTQSEDDRSLAQSIRESPNAVGFFGYAYYERNQDTLQALPVNNITPLPETVDNYPLSRPLYIYTTADALAEKPQVANFINFYLQSVKDYITEVGYFLPGEAALQESIERFGEAIQ